jgi:hypothetical protein
MSLLSLPSRHDRISLEAAMDLFLSIKASGAIKYHCTINSRSGRRGSMADRAFQPDPSLLLVLTHLAFPATSPHQAIKPTYSQVFLRKLLDSSAEVLIVNLRRDTPHSYSMNSNVALLTTYHITLVRANWIYSV